MQSTRLRDPAEAAFREGFAAVLAFAALARADVGSNPAKAARVARDPAETSSVELDDLRTTGLRLLAAWLGDARDSEDFPNPQVNQQHSLALQYAEAVVRQKEVLAWLARLTAVDAPLQAAVTGADRERLEDFLLYRNLRGRFHTVDSLVDDWRRLVERLERRPELLVPEEYENWLVGRDSLETLLSQITVEGRQQIDDCVRPLDERFAAATNPVPASIVTRSPWRPRSWRWHRTPKW